MDSHCSLAHWLCCLLGLPRKLLLVLQNLCASSPGSLIQLLQPYSIQRSLCSAPQPQLGFSKNPKSVSIWTPAKTQSRTS